MRSVTLYVLGLGVFSSFSIALATFFFSREVVTGEMIYWFFLGGLIGGLPSAFIGYLLDDKARNRKARSAEAEKAPAAEVPEAPAPKPADAPAVATPPTKREFRRYAPWISFAILLSAIAGTIFLIDHYSPGNRLDRAMKPFVDANIELLVAYGGRLDGPYRQGEEEDLIAAYDFIRHQGLLAARDELGEQEYGSSSSSEHPMIVCSLRAQRRILDEFKRRCPGEASQNLAKCLSQIPEKRVGKWNRSTVIKTSYELAAGAERAKAYRHGELNVFSVYDLQILKPTAVELQAVMEGEITQSSSQGLGIGSARYGLKGMDYFQFYRPTSFPQMQKVLDQHLSPAVRQKIAAEQRNRKLEPLIDP